jgi:hypothetical protein
MEEKIAEIVECILDDTAVADHSEWLAKRITQALSGICVEVEELEWERVTEWPEDTVEPMAEYTAQASAYPYQVVRLRDHKLWYANIGSGGGWFSTEEAAKTACQADFASRISSCLKTRTVEEVRREYLEELIQEVAGRCTKIKRGGETNSDLMRRVRDAEAAMRVLNCLRSLQEGETDA